MTATLTALPDKFSPGWTGDWATPPQTFPSQALEAVLRREYRTDAHFAPYFLVDLATGRVVDECPRLKKDSLQAVQAMGLGVRFDVAVADVDCPDVHRGAATSAPESWRASAWDLARSACPGCTIYDTRGGIRIIVGLPHRMDVEEYVDWCRRFRGYLRVFGLAVDELPSWAQVYRLPFVVRDGRAQRRRADFQPVTPLQLPATQLASGGKFSGIADAKDPFGLPDRIAQGERHTTLVRYAGWLRSVGKGGQELREMLLALDTSRADPPLSATDAGIAEIEAIAADAEGWDPGPAPPTPPPRKPSAPPPESPISPATAALAPLPPQPPAPPSNRPPVGKSAAPVAQVPAVAKLPPLGLGSHVEIAERVGNRLEDGTVGLVYDRGSLWRYDPSGGLWSPVGHHEVRRIVSLYDGAMLPGQGPNGKVAILKVSADARRAVDEVLRSERDRPGWIDKAPPGIAFSDSWVGLDHKDHLIREEHSPDHRATVGFDFAYTVDEPVLFLRAMAECWRGEPEAEIFARTVGEFVGACLLGITPRFQKAIVFHGNSAANGKSTMQKVVEGLFPKGAVTAIAPQDFGKDYHKAMLANSRLNVVNDLSDKEIDASSSAAFKALVSGDLITARAIREAPFTFCNKSGMLFSCNTLPDVSDTSNGYFRRQIVIPFARQFSEQEAIRKYEDRILTQERPAIVCWALRLAADLVARGHFIEPVASVNAVRAWQRGQDSVALFLEERTVPSDDVRLATDAQTLYSAFATWAAANGHRPLSSVKFWRRAGQLTRRSFDNGDNLRKYMVTLCQ